MAKGKANASPKGTAILANNGVTYVIEDDTPLSSGGQGTIWRVRSKQDSSLYVYKTYKMADTGAVRRNIEALVNQVSREGGFRDRTGQLLDFVVLPITTVTRDGRFGYVMPLVDLKAFTTREEAWQDLTKYPTPQALCRFVQKFALFFETLQSKYGMCYKDINDGNVFINPKTGDLRIIDNDNIGLPEIATVWGTPGYMAPELELALCNPDQFSDRHALAVYLYKLLTNGHPFRGPLFDKYCIDHDMLPYDDDVRREMYGRNPLFAWHPTDKRNCPEKKPEYLVESTMWKSIPLDIQDLFVQTFVTNVGYARRTERTTNKQWMRAFATMESGIMTCPKCHQPTFAQTELCFACNEAMPNKPVRAAAPTPKSSVVFKVISASKGESKIRCTEGTRWSADRISSDLHPGEWFEIIPQRSGTLSIKNISGETWLCRAASGALSQCGPNQVIALEKTQTIALVTKRVNLQVVDLIK